MAVALAKGDKVDMRLLYMGLSLIFVGFTIFEINHALPEMPHAYVWVYALGALVSLLSLKRKYNNLHLLRVFALLSVAVMGLCFATFFVFMGDYAVHHPASIFAFSGIGLHPLLMIIAAFLMLPVIAHFSCRVKAGGCEKYFNGKLDDATQNFLQQPVSGSQNS